MTPQQHLAAISRQFPGAWKQVDIFRQGRGKDLPEWPAWCFLPMAAWAAIASQGSMDPTAMLRGAQDAAKLAALGTWRYSQGVYRFDPDTYAALIDTVPHGELPIEVLYRLPEWCLYVETPGLIERRCAGFWAHLEWDANTGRHELRLLLNQGQHLTPIILHLGRWTITEAVDRAIGDARSRAGHLSGEIPQALAEDLARWAYPLLSLLLYLCSDEPEIDDDRQPAAAPARPEPVKTKKGWRLFPAKKPRIWTVGKTVGDQLRTATTEPGDDDKRAVTPHLRRAHWHGFWTGPRDGERRFNYKWLPPIFVQGRK